MHFRALLILFTFLSALFSLECVASENILLQKYLDQVKAGNSGYRSAVRASKGAMETGSAALLLFTPQGYGSGQRADDRDPANNSATTGKERKQDEYTAGIQGQTPLGQQLKLGWQYDANEILGITSSPIKNYQNSYSIQVSQDLWRNFFGAESRANYGKIRDLSLSGKFGASYAAKQILVGAETLYWSLSISREMLKSRQETLDRSKDLYDWMFSRVARKLGDKSDLMQSESDVQFRTMELAAAMEDVRSASRAFNLMRGVDSDVVDEELELPSEKELVPPMFSTNTPSSDQLRAREFEIKADMKDQYLSGQQVLPSLQAFLSGSYTGMDQTSQKAVSGTTNLTYAVGVKLTAPLNFYSAHRAKKGFDALIAADKLRLEEVGRQHVSGRRDLLRSIDERAHRLKLASDLERTQKVKADYEREKLKRGTTVTAQVLRFEQDLAQSRLARAGTQLELLSLLAKLKLYDEEGSIR